MGKYGLDKTEARMQWWSSRLPSSACHPLSRNQLGLLSDFSSALLIHWFSHFIASFLFPFSEQKLKCHVCYPFAITGLSTLLARLWVAFWMGWFQPGVRSCKALWLTSHFDVHRGALGGPGDVRGCCFLQPSLCLSPPLPCPCQGFNVLWEVKHGLNTFW